MSEDLYDLRDHQTRALGKLSNGKILWGGVGTGKSRVAAAYYHKNEAPKHVYVITTAKKRDSFDWQEEFYRLGIGPASGPSGPGVGAKGLGRKSGKGSDSRLSNSEGATEEATNLSQSSQPESRRGVGKSKPDRRGPEEPSGLLLEGDRRGSDWEDDGSAGRSVGIYPWVLTVDSWNNIAKYADVAGAFFIFDEQRLVGSGDWTRKFLRIAKHNRWILLSGTPGDTWMDYIPVFVANDFYKNRTAFKREHVVYNTFTKFPKVDRYINVGRLMRQRAQLLVEMPYERHTKRRIVEVPLKYDKEALEMVLKKRWHIYENRPLRDVAEMFSVGRKVVNSDQSRIEMVQELWQKHPKLIVFYNFNYELDMLRSFKEYCTTSETANGSEINTVASGSGASTSTQIFGGGSKSILTSSPFSKVQNGISRGLVSISGDGTAEKSIDVSRHSVSIAEWNGHKHQPIPPTDRWLYLVQYTAGAEGWNCIETDAMLMYSRNYSWKVTEQAYGRIDRLNTPFNDLWYYDFMSESFIDLAIGRSLKAKETFNEAKYARLFVG